MSDLKAFFFEVKRMKKKQWTAPSVEVLNFGNDGRFRRTTKMDFTYVDGKLVDLDVR